MIHLVLKREPHWLDLGHGVRVHVRPLTTALMMAARAEVQRAIAPSQNETQTAGERTAALVRAQTWPARAASRGPYMPPVSNAAPG
jgi:hypothetical protein